MTPLFFQQAGTMALGSRIRHLNDHLNQDGKAIYQLEDVYFEPRWFPVFYTLGEEGPMNVSSIAKHIGQSHAAISQVAKELIKRGHLEKTKDANDGRKTILKLSPGGQKLKGRLSNLYHDVHIAVEQLLNEAEHNLWAAIQDVQAVLDEKSLLKRVQDQRKKRFLKEIEIVNYHPKYAKDFRDINVDWIQQHWNMEAADFNSLDHPDTYYIDKGGFIFIALFQGQVAGVVAMIKMENNCYELSKMGVRPIARGKGVGWLLGQTVIEKAIELNAKRLYLESNTVLKPAIRLYRKLGFKEVTTHIPSPYERSNIQMELVFGG